MALLIKANGIVKELDHYPKFDEIHKLIDGYLEYVTLKNVNIDGVDYPYLYCNEDGRMKKLPINNTASTLAWLTILGDVVLFSAADKQRDMSGL